MIRFVTLFLAAVLLVVVWILASGLRDDEVPGSSPTAETASANNTVAGPEGHEGEEAAIEREPVIGEEPAAEPVPEPELRDAIIGRVVDESAAPVANARVLYQHSFDRWYRTVSGADGKFRLDGVPPFEREELIVAHPSYCPAVFDVAVYGGGVLDVGVLAVVGGGTISGRVLSPSSAPVASAVVKARPREGDVRSRLGRFVMLGSEERESLAPLDTVTGPDGRFQIEGVPAGSVHLFAFHPHYLAGAARDLAVQEGTETADVTLVMDGGNAITGLLRDTKGDPIEGARVTVDKAGHDFAPDGYYGSIPESFVRPSTHSDATGAFSISGLEEGDYQLNFARPSFRTAYRADVPAAITDLEVVLYASARLTGTVTAAATGQPVMAYELDVGQVGVADADLRVSRDGDAGAFVVDGLYPGGFSLSVSSEGFVTKVLNDLRIQVGEDNSIEVSLDRSAVLAGRLVFRDGDPVGERTVLVGRIAPVRDSEPLVGQSRADGTFRFAHLPPGDHVVAALTLQGLPACEERIALTAGEQREGLILTYEDSAGLEGLVRDVQMKPVRSGRVILRPATMEQVVVVKTDNDGRYAFTHLRPGEYRVKLADFTGLSTGEKSVQVRPDSVATLDLFEPDRGTVSGTVTTRGVPSQGVEVEFRNADRGASNISREVKTDASGRYEVRLYPGAYHVRVDSRGLPIEQRTIEVQRGALMRHDITLPPGKVTGRIVDGKSGQPIRWVKVWLLKSDDAFAEHSYPLSSGAGGLFELLHVRDGVYDLFASRSGHGYMDTTVGFVEVSGGGETSVGDVVLRQGFSIRVRVVNALTGRIETPRVELVRIDESTGDSSKRKPLSSNWTRYYYESGLAPGSYRLESTGDTFEGVHSFELIDRDRRDLVLRVSPRGN